MHERILYEDNHYIAVNKRNGELVQADKSGDAALVDMVKDFVRVRDAKPGRVFLEAVHRIDRPVSGVVLMAKTSKGLSRINRLFQEGQVKRTYWAVVKNPPPNDSATLTQYLVRDTKLNKSYVYSGQVKGSKLAKLRYSIVLHSANYFVLEIDLLTGRHHQIRCQLAKMGCPIKGDLKYGFPRSNPDGGIHLHARSINFVHPVTNQAITIVAPPPTNDRLWELMKER